MSVMPLIERGLCRCNGTPYASLAAPGGQLETGAIFSNEIQSVIKLQKNIGSHRENRDLLCRDEILYQTFPMSSS